MCNIKKDITLVYYTISISIKSKRKKLEYIHKYLFIEHSRSCMVRFTSEKYRSVSKLELDTSRQVRVLIRIEFYCSFWKYWYYFIIIEIFLIIYFYYISIVIRLNRDTEYTVQTNYSGSSKILLFLWCRLWWSNSVKKN